MHDDSTYERPTVWVDDGDLRGQADAALKALATWSNEDPANPRVAVRGDVLVRMNATDGELQALDVNSLSDDLSGAARFAKLTTQGHTRPEYPPERVVKAMLSRNRAGYPGMRVVERMTDVPIVGKSGDLVTEPGLRDDGIWYRPARGLGEVTADVSETCWEVIEARERLLEHLGEFDFADDASRANAMALMLLPFVRGFIGGASTPMHAVVAPQNGSGKTYLTKACLLPACGIVDLTGAPDNEDEMRKAITTALLYAKPAIVIDNVATGRRLESAHLARALTATRWWDRVLGKNVEASMPIRCTWVLTGNNVDANEDLLDRMVHVRLTPRDGVPARQRARDPEAFERHPVEDGDRTALVAACLTLARHWLAGHVEHTMPDGTLVRDEGRRTPPDATMGSYERWSEVVGGILAAAGVDGFLANLVESPAGQVSEATALFHACRREYGDAEFLTRDLWGMMSYDGAQLCELRPSTVDAARDKVKSLGKWLSGNVDRTEDGLTLRRRVGSGDLVHWHIEERG